MRSQRLLAAGFTDIIPIRPGLKIPAIRGWSQRGPVTEGEAESWDETGYEVGMLARNFPAIDIDIDDARTRIFAHVHSLVLRGGKADGVVLIILEHFCCNRQYASVQVGVARRA